MTDVVEYKIAEYLEEPEIDGDMSSQEVYLVAAHRESRSRQFYTELANLHADGNTQTMLLKMANEELKHKEKMEYLYSTQTMLLKMANEELKHKEKMEYLYSNTAFPQTSGG
jgi:rubrerythrin